MTKASDIEKKFYEDFVNDKANAFKNAFMSCYNHVQELLKIRNTRTYAGIYSCIEEGENLWKAFCRKINSKYPGAVFENGFEEATTGSGDVIGLEACLGQAIPNGTYAFAVRSTDGKVNI